MKEEYGNDYISVTDEEGNEFELEHLDTLEHEGSIYMAFLPADMDEDDDDYGMIILKAQEQDGEQMLATVDNEKELECVYTIFMEQLFSEEDDVQ